MKKKTTKKTKKKMPPKTSKITDVTDPGKTAPSASGRPIVVTNRPVLPNDPMLVERSGSDSEVPSGASVAGSSVGSVGVNRTAKTIAPVSPDMQVLPASAPDAGATTDGGHAELSTFALSVPNADTTPTLPVEEDAASVAEKPNAKVSGPAVAPQSPAPEPLSPEVRPKPTLTPAAGLRETEDDSETSADSKPADADAAAIEAEAARLQQLEQLVASGTYAVPIDAVQRHRSRVFVAVMCLLAVVLAVALLDAALDSGLLKLSLNVPHTHLLSTN